MHSYHTRQECITHKQNKHSTIIFTDFRREATISNHSIFRHDDFIGCFSADKIKKSVRK